MDNLIKETKSNMESAVEVLKERHMNVRAGRAHPSMVDQLNVDYYGAKTPLNQIANVTIPEARQLFIKPYDKSALKDIEIAINEANLGVSPVNNGEFVIVTLPELTEESRKTYVKQIKKMAEESKISLRTIREDARNTVKREDLSEDEEERYFKQIQDLIDEYNSQIEQLTNSKEKELMTI